MTVSSINHPIVKAISNTLHGKDSVIALVYASFLAGGHVLLEDVPGVGKTTLAHALANAAGLPFKRLQCTNDLLPSDILGVTLWNQEKKAFEFHEGPIFTNVLVADEINRAPSKSQSSLLEAMEEGQVSIDGKHFVLPSPFWVVATQNPAEHSGTNQLPESQLDRFLIKVSLGYPDEQSEKRMLMRSFEKRRGEVVEGLHIDVHAERKQAQDVVVREATLDYIYRLVAATRDPQLYRLGLSPRAALGLVAMAKSWAWLHGRNYVTPDDIQAVFPSIAGHRLFPKTMQPMDAIHKLLATTPVHQ